MDAIPIRETFDAAVKDSGGEVISELMSDTGKLAKNADYLFRAEQVIAELKCLESDLTKSAEYQAKLERLHGSWVARGLVAPLAPGMRRIINARNLPLPCAHELIDTVKPVIEKRVRKANEQIKQTKRTLNMPRAYGLLILANDGNYAIGPEPLIKFCVPLPDGHKLQQHQRIDLLYCKHADRRARRPAQFQCLDPGLSRATRRCDQERAGPAEPRLDPPGRDSSRTSHSCVPHR